MTAARAFLGFSALIWIGYGTYCFFQPGSLGGNAGVSFTSTTGSTEIRAMYGGLEAAIGALALAGALHPRLLRTALIAIAFLSAGLAIGRAGGLAIDGAVSAYNASALVFEIASAGLATWLLGRVPAAE